MVKIEKNIPFPFGKASKARLNIDTLGEMVVGDSVFFPAPKGGFKAEYTERNRLSQHRTRAQIRWPDRKWALRAVEGGYRIWRVQ